VVEVRSEEAWCRCASCNIRVGSRVKTWIHMLLDASYICWGLFIGIWAIGALYNARYAPRTVSRDSWSSVRPWQGWIVGAVLVLLVRAFVPTSVWAAFSFRNDVLADIGLAILVSSTLFTLWARWTLGKMWSSVPALREEHELHTDGPYRVTRHPIYTGILGMLFGSALVIGLGGVVVGLLVFGGVFLIRIRREEQLMLQTFGEQYVRYQRRVPRIVPFVRI
jgi:protein-S-isoprenylcysteine O-methyltransferase Ste14